MAAVAVAAGTVKQVFFPAATATPGAAADRELDDALWSRLVEASRPVSSRDSGAVMVVLTDFECPACRQFHSRLQRVLASAMTRGQIRYAHLPLSYHRFALPAARVFECVAGQGQDVGPFADAVFGAQDSLGVLAWQEFAQRAGAPAPEVAAACATDADSAAYPLIWEGLALAEELAVRGTPAVVVDGVLLGLPPAEQRLAEMLRAP